MSKKKAAKPRTAKTPNYPALMTKGLWALRRAPNDPNSAAEVLMVIADALRHEWILPDLSECPELLELLEDPTIPEPLRKRLANAIEPLRKQFLPEPLRKYLVDAIDASMCKESKEERAKSLGDELFLRPGINGTPRKKNAEVLGLLFRRFTSPLREDELKLRKAQGFVFQPKEERKALDKGLSDDAAARIIGETLQCDKRTVQEYGVPYRKEYRLRAEQLMQAIQEEQKKEIATNPNSDPENPQLFSPPGRAEAARYDLDLRELWIIRKYFEELKEKKI